MEQNEPDIKLQKFDTYAAAKTAFENGTGVAWANDNTEVIAYAKENPGYVVGIYISWRSAEYCTGCNKMVTAHYLTGSMLKLRTLEKKTSSMQIMRTTLLDTYGADYEDTLVIEGGATK